ncbi:steroid 17-alpha-hydroxylase/17,20 lyase isoform X1 [Melanotaenia boesemani]|uniref:steroid 17-alpha-hydroxylase/17,20 lyase isoform X1 n=1 Tax=Melanotaenia boesemani TaxID=1250792 RepID=UPI001C04F52B|nr:steroid 17-alpha-hydroxylase/17,20 lyase isoform X1 [Melanotaenia boesemani]
MTANLITSRSSDQDKHTHTVTVNDNTHTFTAFDLSKVSSCVTQIKVRTPHRLLTLLRLLADMLTYLLSSFSLSVLLVFIFFVVIVLLSKPLLSPKRAHGSIPCLPRVPVLGSLPWLGGSLPPHLLFSQLARRYGPLFALYLGPHYTVVVNDHQHAREVLLQRGRDFAGRPSMVTTNLLTRGGKDIAFSDYSPLWKSHRRLVHNSFTLFGEGTTRLQDIVLSAVDSLCIELLSNGTRGFDPCPAVTRAVTNVVCTLVFSSTYRHGDCELQEVIRYNNGIVETIARGGLVDIYPWLKVFPNTSLSKLKECIAVRDRLLSRKLEEHKATLSDGDPRDLLDALLKGQTGRKKGQKPPGPQEEGITDDHVLMTAAEAFGAGVETTSTTLLWILAYLLHHPEVQEGVQKELDENVGSERAVSVSDRGHLPYLDCVINEGMRIRPVSPVLIPHTAMTNSSIGGHAVSQGTRVLINMWSIHHDPQHWDKPDLFNPDRFLDNLGQRVTPSCFLPFGAGPRVCVGESLARLELFLFLSSLLQRMSFRLPTGASPPNLQGRLGVVLQPLPYKVVVTPRPGWEGRAK